MRRGPQGAVLTNCGPEMRLCAFDDIWVLSHLALCCVCFLCLLVFLCGHPCLGLGSLWPYFPHSTQIGGFAGALPYQAGLASDGRGAACVALQAWLLTHGAAWLLDAASLTRASGSWGCPAAQSLGQSCGVASKMIRSKESDREAAGSLQRREHAYWVCLTKWSRALSLVTVAGRVCWLLA